MTAARKFSFDRFEEGLDPCIEAPIFVTPRFEPFSEHRAGCRLPERCDTYKTNDLTFTLPIVCAFLDIGERWRMASHDNDGDTEWGWVGPPVSTPVQSKAMCFSA
tara:strand:+ start:9540 stop:9854 length:315 start_codon:yes stop_codon:yes gene_type:complete